jgi:hypothetical protein
VVCEAVRCCSPIKDYDDLSRLLPSPGAQGEGLGVRVPQSAALLATSPPRCASAATSTASMIAS